MYNGREDKKHILIHVHFERFCRVIKKFPELKQYVVIEGITFSLLLSSNPLKGKEILMNYKTLWKNMIQ